MIWADQSGGRKRDLASTPRMSCSILVACAQLKEEDVDTSRCGFFTGICAPQVKQHCANIYVASIISTLTIEVSTLPDQDFCMQANDLLYTMCVSQCPGRSICSESASIWMPNPLDHLFCNFMFLTILESIFVHEMHN